jgi:hypothetical protein
VNTNIKRLLPVKNRIRLAMLLLVLVAFALRVHRLDYQALRGDEAFAHLFAQQPLREMLPSLATIEPHPPLYYTTLHLWTSLLGQGEFAARFLSVLVSILMIPMIYRLGSALCGAKVGWLAAFLGSINPFLIWHSQDVRMYSMLACLGLGSVLLFSLALERGDKSSEKGLWSGYVILTIGALYVHYFSLFILAIENLTFLCLYLFPGRRRREETNDGPAALDVELGPKRCPEPCPEPFDYAQAAGTLVGDPGRNRCSVCALAPLRGQIYAGPHQRLDRTCEPLLLLGKVPRRL